MGGRVEGGGAGQREGGMGRSGDVAEERGSVSGEWVFSGEDVLRSSYSARYPGARKSV